MIKICGIVMIIFSCLAISASIIKKQTAALNGLRSLISSLKEMRDCITVYKMPLPEIIISLKEHKDDTFFKSVSQHIEAGEKFSVAWNNATDKDSSLPIEAKKALLALGISLGSMDTEQEKENIDFCINSLLTISDDRAATTQKNSKMLRSFGLLSGLLIVILFI